MFYVTFDSKDFFLLFFPTNVQHSNPDHQPQSVHPAASWQQIQTTRIQQSVFEEWSLHWMCSTVYDWTSGTQRLLPKPNKSLWSLWRVTAANFKVSVCFRWTMNHILSSHVSLEVNVKLSQIRKRFKPWTSVANISLLVEYKVERRLMRMWLVFKVFEQITFWPDGGARWIVRVIGSSWGELERLTDIYLWFSLKGWFRCCWTIDEHCVWSILRPLV